MKKIESIFFLVIVFSVFAISCKSDKNTEKQITEDKEKIVASDEFTSLKGEFIHVDTAAVLKVNNKLYGVKMDEMAKSVIEKANVMKADDYDVINIDIKAEINPNTEPEGWEEIVTIKSLENIYKPQVKEETKVLKYSSQKTE